MSPAGWIVALAMAPLALGVGSAPARPGTPVPTQVVTYALKGARVLDVAAGTYSAPAVILVRGGRITRIAHEAEYRAGPADSTVDLSGKYLLPGLIDAHVHLGIGGPPAATALADLRAGFTTVVDLGAVTHRILQVRDSIGAGLLPGPRVLAAGIWVGIKGGVCEFTGIGIAGGAEDFRRRIRENAEAGADVVKLCVSGWPADAYRNPEGFELPDDVLAASVAEARSRGKLVIAHAISRGSVQAALRAGVDGLAHAAYVDSATAAAMRAKNMFMISTVASLTGADTSAASRALRAAVGLAHRLGVRIILGTDGGVLAHGRNADELLALGAVGLSPIEAIRAATLHAAAILRLADSIGAVRPGMVADLVALDGDPLRDLAVLKQPRLVMARGRIVAP